jgi:leader peptidase (prepilin peptidase) / N-methyltransferase
LFCVKNYGPAENMEDTLALAGSVEFRLFAGIVTGLILGSFATMLSYRLPRGISILWPRSHCPACKTRVKPRDLVPLLSFAAQGGKCRFCGTFIGWRYPAIEASLALASAAAFVLFGLTLWLIIALALLTASVTAAAIWLEQRGAK